MKLLMLLCLQKRRIFEQPWQNGLEWHCLVLVVPERYTCWICYEVNVPLCSMLSSETWAKQETLCRSTRWGIQQWSLPRTLHKCMMMTGTVQNVLCRMVRFHRHEQYLDISQHPRAVTQMNTAYIYEILSIYEYRCKLSITSKTAHTCEFTPQDSMHSVCRLLWCLRCRWYTCQVLSTETAAVSIVWYL